MAFRLLSSLLIVLAAVSPAGAFQRTVLYEHYTASW